MSEEGWRAFLAAGGLGDWAVLHSGAMAVFRVRSLGEAVRLAEAIEGAADDAHLGPSVRQLSSGPGAPVRRPTPLRAKRDAAPVALWRRVSGLHPR